MSIVDELIVELKIDASQFTSGEKAANESLKGLEKDSKKTSITIKKSSDEIIKVQLSIADNAKKTADDLGKSGKDAGGFFSKIRNEALMMLGVFTAGATLKSFAKDTINAAASSGILASQIGVSVTKLEAMEAAAQRVGVSSGAMSEQLAKDAKRASDVEAGGSIKDIYSAKFQQYGGDYTNMDNADGQMEEYAKIFQRLKETALKDNNMSDMEATAYASQQITDVGLSAELIPLISQGTIAVKAQIAEQMKKVAITDKDAAAAGNATSKWFDFTQQIDQVSKRIVFALIPSLEKVTAWLEQLEIPTSESMAGTIDKWVKKLEELIDAAKKGANYVDDFVESVGGWELVLKSLLALKVASWVIGLASLTAGLLGFSTVAGAAAGAAKALFLGLGGLLALGGAAAAGAAIGSLISDNLSNETNDAIGGTIDESMKIVSKKAKTAKSFIYKSLGINEDSNDEKEEGNDNKKSVQYEKVNPRKRVKKDRKSTMAGVYRSFTNAGFSKKQSKALTAEVGRENDYNHKYVFGSHTDAANKKTNIGFISWQGSRARKLKARMTKKGLIGKNGRMKHTQAALNEQALFLKEELGSGQYKGGKAFIKNKNVSSRSAAKTLGKGFIKWAYGQNSIGVKGGKRSAFDWKSHDRRRKRYYDQVDGAVASDNKGRKIIPLKTIKKPPIKVIVDNKKGSKEPLKKQSPFKVITKKVDGKIIRTIKKPPTKVTIEKDKGSKDLFKKPESFKTATKKVDGKLVNTTLPEKMPKALTNNNNNAKTVTVNNDIIIKSTEPKAAANEVKTTLTERATASQISGM